MGFKVDRQAVFTIVSELYTQMGDRTREEICKSGMGAYKPMSELVIMLEKAWDKVIDLPLE